MDYVACIGFLLLGQIMHGRIMQMHEDAHFSPVAWVTFELAYVCFGSLNSPTYPISRESPRRLLSGHHGGPVALL